MEAKNEISGDYIAGFTDGEGCFSLTYRKDKGRYFYWKASFIIMLRGDDGEILNTIKDYFKCGSVTFTKDAVRYQIYDTKMLINTIIPFFEKHSLIGKKKYDFDLWKKSVNIIYKNKKENTNSEAGVKGFTKNEWNNGDLEELRIIREKMQIYKSGGKGRTLKY